MYFCIADLHVQCSQSYEEVLAGPIIARMDNEQHPGGRACKMRCNGIVILHDVPK
jgi:hypothetical protein